jgi:hypothetical protein
MHVLRSSTELQGSHPLQQAKDAMTGSYRVHIILLSILYDDMLDTHSVLHLQNAQAAPHSLNLHSTPPRLHLRGLHLQGDAHTTPQLQCMPCMQGGYIAKESPQADSQCHMPCTARPTWLTIGCAVTRSPLAPGGAMYMAML